MKLDLVIVVCNFSFILAIPSSTLVTKVLNKLKSLRINRDAVN